jgi:hypothetical protein
VDLHNASPVIVMPAMMLVSSSPRPGSSAAGVAVAGAAVASRRVLREAQVARPDRVEGGDRVLARIQVADYRPARLVDRLLRAVADGGELLILGHAVELAEGGQLRRRVPRIGLSKTTTAMWCGSLCDWLNRGSA